MDLLCEYLAENKNSVAVTFNDADDVKALLLCLGDGYEGAYERALNGIAVGFMYCDYYGNDRIRYGELNQIRQVYPHISFISYSQFKEQYLRQKVSLVSLLKGDE